MGPEQAEPVDTTEGSYWSDDYLAKITLVEGD